MNSAATFDLEAFHAAQRRRLCNPRVMRPLEGRFAEALGRELGKHVRDCFEGTEADADSVVICFARTPEADVQKLFHALTQAVAAARPLSVSDSDWVCELVVYAAVKCLDASYWLSRDVPLNHARSSRARVTFIDSASSLVIIAGLSGLAGRAFRMGRGAAGDIDNLIDLSHAPVTSEIEQSFLAHAYDQVFQRTQYRRDNITARLDEKQKGHLRSHFDELRSKGLDGIVYFKLPSLDRDQLNAVASSLAVAVNATVVVGSLDSDERLLLEGTDITIGSLHSKIEKIVAQLPVFDTVDTPPQPKRPVQPAPAAMPEQAAATWDVFLSHASDDKVTFVDQLATALKSVGLRVWYDKDFIKPGMSVTQAINQGLADSRFAVVVFSEAFLRKGWTKAEMQAVFNASVSQGRVRLIPVLLDITRDKLVEKVPLIADLAGISAADGLPKVTAQILDVVTSD